MFDKTDRQAPETFPTNPVEHHSPLHPAEQEQGPAIKPTQSERIVHPAIRTSTGPRTTQGKERSKYNAVKHGGYCKKQRLPNESPSEHKKMWNKLWGDLQPTNTLATEIFTDIFITLLNRRRFHTARHAMIAEKVQFSENERSVIQQTRALYLDRWGCADGGMLQPGENQLVLKKCIETLEDIRSSVEKYGLDVENDGHRLTKLYGTEWNGVIPLGLGNTYYLLAAKCILAERGEEQNVDPNVLKGYMLKLLDFEIARVTALEKSEQGRERIRSKFKVDQSLVLSQKELDVEMRHDTHFTRNLARLLSLFEYAQRMSPALSVLPPNKDEV